MIVIEAFLRGQTPKSRAPPWEDAGPFRVAITPKSELHQVDDGKIESQSAMPCQENQHFFALPVITQSFGWHIKRCSRKPQSP